MVFGNLHSIKGRPTILEKWKISPTSITEYSRPRSTITNCCIKLSTPKPYQGPTHYKTVRALTENVDTSCEIQLRNETCRPKTKYLTVVEINGNASFDE